MTHPPGRVLQSDYMRFAKLDTAARYNLASSGVADCTLADLGASLDDLALHGPNAYGYAPLVERIAGRFGIDPTCVVTAAAALRSPTTWRWRRSSRPATRCWSRIRPTSCCSRRSATSRPRSAAFDRRPEEAWRLDPERGRGRA